MQGKDRKERKPPSYLQQKYYRMTKRFTTLQRKLQELEARLQHVFSLPPDTPDRQLYSKDIEQRFRYLRILLSAEVASSPAKPVLHLERIANRLSVLESKFQEWDDYCRSEVTTNHQQGHVETASTCCCAESCIDGKEEEDAALDLDSQGTFHGGVEEESGNNVLQGLMEEEKVGAKVETVRVDDDDDKVEEEESDGFEGEQSKRSGGSVGKYCRAMACGMAIGMALMSAVMVKLCGCSPYVERAACLAPT